jgi:thiol-activated cytolysin
MVVGGPTQLAQQISDYASFVSFIQSPTTASLVASSVPISYKVRRLKDNTQVLVKDIFASQYKELKAN